MEAICFFETSDCPNYTALQPRKKEAYSSILKMEAICSFETSDCPNYTALQPRKKEAYSSILKSSFETSVSELPGITTQKGHHSL
jgi:hypothetical protein